MTDKDHRGPGPWLFAVRQGGAQRSEHFYSKRDAKAYRDSIGGANVTRGPDHWRETVRPYK